VRFQCADFGRIQDVNLKLRWDPANFAAEVFSCGRYQAWIDRYRRPFWKCEILCTTAACIDPALTPSEVTTLVEFVEPSAILVGEIPTTSFDGRVGVPIFELSRAISSQAPIPAVVGDPDRPALILFTSGTTGHPKGVVLPFSSLLNRIRAQ
jgi:AMP-binding enzyme